MAQALLLRVDDVLGCLGSGWLYGGTAFLGDRGGFTRGLPDSDALANFVDASRSGGLGQNCTQTINVVVSVATTLAVVLALAMSMNWVLGVFGVWAILSGLLQLGSAVRRWKSYGAQWAMILSGGQSALAGTFFIVQARMPMPPSITNVAGYAAVGAFYFLVSAVWLSVSQLWRKTA